MEEIIVNKKSVENDEFVIDKAISDKVKLLIDRCKNDNEFTKRDFIELSCRSPFSITEEGATECVKNYKKFILSRTPRDSIFEENDSGDDVEVNEHEKTRKTITDRLDEYCSKLATKDDIIKSKDEIIESLRSESKQIQNSLNREIEELKSELNEYLPYKRSFRMSLYSITLFSSLFAFKIFFNIKIIDDFWNTLGLFLSFGFLVMSYFMRKDYEKL